jgi:[ribosomal protein S18]-alanine N-acetyltransferase
LKDSDASVRVRRADAADIPVMIELESQGPAAAHWSGQQYEGLFAATGDPRRAERLAWVAEDESEALEVLAFLVAHRVDSEWELENIVVARSARRRGAGTRLLGEFVGHARAEQGRGIFLEVRESNHSGRALYRKAGFEETGLRKSYYSNPTEDAILCRLRL